jgi:predicted nucleotide-binding protein
MVSLRILVNNKPMDIAFSRAMDDRGPINHQLCEVNPPPQGHERYNFNGSLADPIPFYVTGINGTARDSVKMIAGDHYCIFLKHQVTHMPDKGISTGLSIQEAALARSLFEEIVRLDSIHSLVNIVVPQPISIPDPSPAKPPESPVKDANMSKKVFIVHGHDETAKLSLENFIYSVGLEPIVLHRQPDGGRTIIEKFEEHANEISYAFILMTPDEITYLRSESEKADTDRKKEFRARPNVIFEFGYFVGALSRKKVCCIHTGNVKLPSDLNGLVYKGYKNSIEEIKHELRQELIHAGFKLRN